MGLDINKSLHGDTNPGKGSQVLIPMVMTLLAPKVTAIGHRTRTQTCPCTVILTLEKAPNADSNGHDTLFTPKVTAMGHGDGHKHVPAQ